MTERPILFSAPMVRAILDDSKTQTRRVVRPQPSEGDKVFSWGPDSFYRAPVADPRVADFRFFCCPHGSPGDTLWVRETWCNVDDGDPAHDDRISAVLDEDGYDFTAYRADDWLDCPAADGRWRSSIFMPRRRSRITLEVMSVRVERIQEISLDDIRAEGVRPDQEASLLWRETLAENFRDLWDGINGRRGFGWHANPWVWCIAFTRVRP